MPPSIQGKCPADDGIHKAVQPPVLPLPAPAPPAAGDIPADVVGTTDVTDAHVRSDLVPHTPEVAAAADHTLPLAPALPLPREVSLRAVHAPTLGLPHVGIVGARAGGTVTVVRSTTLLVAPHDALLRTDIAAATPAVARLIVGNSRRAPHPPQGLCLRVSIEVAAVIGAGRGAAHGQRGQLLAVRAGVLSHGIRRRRPYAGPIIRWEKSHQAVLLPL